MVKYSSINLSSLFPQKIRKPNSKIEKERTQIDMCNKSSSVVRPPNLRNRSRSLVNNNSKNNSSKPSAARKSRSKTRKPKFLSLRLQLSQKQQQTTSSNSNDMSLNLFPLHPENMNDDGNVALLFDSDGGGGEGGATLNGLLTSTATTSTTTAATMSSEEDSISMSYAAYGGRSEESLSLVRTAMRNRERDRSEEEKWVCYSEVVEKKEADEDMETTSSSCAADARFHRPTTKGLLSLKLDYDGILNAWSDKGSLYIHGDSPQTVPALHDPHTMLMDGLGSAENVWKVPEGKVSSPKTKAEMGGREGWKIGQREASVLRYKEKRQSRLFAKRIRYEVRKLNAEKRPRMKGRFVKRN